MGTRISPNKNLAMGALIAQGAEKFLSAYQGQQARNNAQAIQQMRLSSEMELRKMQMEKLRQETAPVEFDLQKLNVMLKGVESGFVPESVYNKSVQETVNSIDSPAKLMAANNALSAANARKANAMVPYAPGMEPVQSAVVPSSRVQMSPREAEFFGKMVSARGQMASMGQRREAAELQYDAKLQDIESKMANAKDDREFKALEGEYNRASQERIAGIRAKAGIEAAKIRGNRPGRVVESPQAKALANRIAILDKQIAKEMGSPSGMSMDIPGAREERAKALKADRDSLLQQYNEMVGGGQAPTPQAAPAKPAAKAAAPKAASNVFKRSDAGVVQKMKALPEGSQFTLDGESYKIQNGAPVKE